MEKIIIDDKNRKDLCECRHPLGSHQHWFDLVSTKLVDVALPCRHEDFFSEDPNGIRIPCECKSFKLDNLAWVAKHAKK